jgi:hypothetical protein
MRGREAAVTNTIVIDSFRAALYLNGWERRSIWGWDVMTSSLFAHLWPNGDDSGHPPVIIPSSWDPSARWPATADPAQLARHIMQATGCSAVAVLRAMADQAPAPLKEMFESWLSRDADATPGWGGYFRRDDVPGLTIYGHVLNPDEIRRAEHTAGVSAEEADAALAGISQAFKRGYRYGWCYSADAPEGELGAVHVSQCVPLTASEFEAARRCGWRAA